MENKTNIEASLIAELEATKLKVKELEARLAFRSDSNNTQALLEALWNISKIADSDFRVLCEHVLTEIKILTGSTFAGFGYMNDDESMLTVYSWSKEVVDNCRVADEPLVFETKNAGAWAEPIRQRKSVIINDFLGDNPYKKGFPEGHVLFHNFLSVPVFSGDRIATLAFVANKSSDFTPQDADILERFLKAAQIILDRNIAREELRISRLKHKELVDQIPVGVYRSNSEGKLLFANQALAKMLEYDSVDELLAQNVYDIYEDASDRMTQIEQWEKFNLVDLNDLKLRTKFGKTLYVHDIASIITDEFGKMMYFDGIIENVSERKKYYDALTDRESNLRAILDNAPVAIWTIDKNLKIGYYNKLFEQSYFNYFGLRIEDNKMLFGDPKEILRSWIERYHRALNGEKNVAEDKFSTTNGDFYTQTYYSPIVKGNLEITGILMIAQDITEKKQILDSVKASEERFRSLTQNSSDIIAIIDDYGKLKFVTSVVEKIIGLPERKLINKNVFYYIHNDDVERIKELFLEIIHTPHRKLEAEFRLKTGRGDYVWIEAIATNHLANPHIQGIVVNARDISDRKQTTEVLRESEEMFRNVFDYSTVGIGILSPDGTVVNLNNSLLQLLGYSLEEAVNMGIENISHPDDFVDEICLLDDLISGEIEFYTVEKRFLTKHNEYIWTLETVSLVRDSGNEPFLIIGIVIDISNRKKAEVDLIESQNSYREEAEKNFNMNVQLQELVDQLQETNITKDKFFSIIAHDLRGPISSFTALAEILATEFSTLPLDDIQEMSKAMLTTSITLYEMLNNLLDWSRIQRGVIEYKPHYAALNQIVNTNVKLIQSSLQRKNITIVNLTPEGLNVFADTFMLDTVIRNLLNNAVKFTYYNGEITIGADLMESGKARVFVKDNGTGIDEETMKNIFRIDRKTSQPGTCDEKGSGLGLILCKEFIALHGESIHVISKPEEGSTFYFDLQTG